MVPVSDDRPSGRPAIRMVWESLLFAHWPVPPDALRRLVPPALEIDTFDGAAWIGLVPFTMPVFRLNRLPPVPTMSRFHECNVRTYVRERDGGGAGVWFLSLDATSRLAVRGARRLWRLPYHLARIGLRRDGDDVRYSVDRVRPGPVPARLRCAWRAGAPRQRPSPGDLAHFLTERYALYAVDRRGRPRRGPIRHDPWPLRDAELLDLDDTLVAAAGVRVPECEPVLHHADRLEVDAWPLERFSA